MSTSVIVVAAGSGTRLRADRPKALVDLDGSTILQHAVRGACAVSAVRQVVVVAPESSLGELDLAVPDDIVLSIVAGGAERTDSVAAGLAALEPACTHVLVHDAARCLTPPAVYERVVEALRDGAPAVVPGVPVVDTIKVVDAVGRVTATPVRAHLRAVQTPQGFEREALRQAHASGTQATDDAALAEACGIPVLVVDGDPRARKVTTPEDLAWARRELA